MDGQCEFDQDYAKPAEMNQNEVCRTAFNYALTPDSYKNGKNQRTHQSQKMEDIMREMDIDRLSNEFVAAKNRSHPTMREEFLYKSFDSPLKSTTAYENVQTNNLKSSADIYLY